MNKIFKTVWNEATQSWVAVSELAKTQGKSVSGLSGILHKIISKLFKLSASALAVVSVLFSTTAQAEGVLYVNDGTDPSCGFLWDQATYGASLMHIGGIIWAQTPSGVVTNTGRNAASIGLPGAGTGCAAGATKDTQTSYATIYSGNNSTNFTLGGRLDVNSGVIGVGARGDNTHAIKIGGGSTLTQANAAQAITLGYDSAASQANATAIGHVAKANGGGAIALGPSSTSGGTHSIAIGGLSTASKNNAIAIGTSANASLADSVALGQGSTTTAGTKVSSSSVNGLAFSGFAGTLSDTNRVVGVGGRQIQGVAAGAVSATSTDAINGSQLYATQNVIANVAKSTTAVLGSSTTLATNGTLTTTNLGGTGKNTVHDAIAAVKATADSATTKSNSPLSFNANSGTTINRTLGQTLKISGGLTAATGASGKNIHVQSNGSDTLNILMSDAPTFTAVTATTATIGSGANTTTLTSTANGLDVGGDKITNVGDAVNASDAVNKKQLDAATKASTDGLTALKAQTFKLQANNDTASAVKSDDTVKFIDGKNVAISRSGNNITVATKDDVSFTKTTVGTVVTNSTTNKISGLAAGTVSGTSTEAVNGSQLYGVANNVKTVLGSSTTIAANGTLTTTNLGGTGTSTVHDAIAAVKATADSATTKSNSPLSFTGNSGTKIDRTLGQTLKIEGGLATATAASNKNIRTETAGDTVKILLAEAPTFTAVTATTATIGSGANTTTLTSTANGLDVGGDRITNVGNAVNTGDAVNKGQLDAATKASADGLTALKAQTFKLQVNNDTASAVKSDDTVKFVDGKNVAISRSGNNITVATKDEVSFTKTTVGTVVTDSATNKISGLTAGSVTSGSTEAVNGGQLYGVANNVKSVLGSSTAIAANGALTTTNLGGTGTNTVHDAIAAVKATADSATTKSNLPLSFTGNSGTKIDRTLGQTLKIEGGLATAAAASNKNIRTETAGDTVKILLADAPIFTAVTATTATIGSGANTTTLTSTVDGLSVGGDRITNVGNAVNTGDAVNKGQLDAATKASTDGLTALKAQTFKLQANNDAASAVKSDDTVKFIDGKNVAISRSGNNITVATKDDVSFTKTTVGSVVTNGTTNKISGLAAGSVTSGSTEAVNGGQLYNVANNVKSLIGGNATINPTNGTVTATDIGGTGQTTVNDAIAHLRTGGIKVNADNNNAKVNPLGATLSVVSGNATNTSSENLNTKVEQDGTGTKITVSMKKDPNFDSLSLTTAGGVKTTLTPTSNGLTLATGGANSKLSGVATATASDSDDVAANKGYVDSVVNSAGWTLKGDGATKDTAVVKGDSVDFIDGDGTDAVVTNAGTASTVKYNVKTVTLTNGAGGVVTSPNPASDKVFATAGNVADVVNVAVNGLSNKGIAVNADTGGQQTHKLGNELVIAGGNATGAVSSTNLKTTVVQDASGKTTVTVAMKDAPTFTAVTATTATIGSGTNTTTLTSTADGLSVGGDRITNVGNAVNSGDAVNKGQMDTAIATVKTEAKGYGWVLQQGGSVKDDKVIDSDVVNFVNGNGTTASVTTNAGKTSSNVTFNVKTSGFTSGTDGKVTGVTAGDSFATAADVAAAINNAVDKVSSGAAAQSFKLQANGDTASIVGAATTVQFKNGDNINITRNTTNPYDITIATAKEVKFDKTTVGTVVTDSTTNKISGLAAGTVASGSTEAVNGSQLYGVANNVKTVLGSSTAIAANGALTTTNLGGTGTNTVHDAIAAVKATADSATTKSNFPLSFTGNSGTKIDRTLGQTLKIEGGLATATGASGKNIHVQSNGSDTINILMSDSPNFTAVTATTATIGSGTNTTTLTSTANGLDVGGDKITNVGDAVNASDAVNKKQLDAATKASTDGLTALKAQTFKLQANNDTASAVKSDDTVKFIDGKNVAISRSGNNITVATKDEVSFNKTTVGSVVTNGTTNKISGLAAGSVTSGSTEAVNGGQLFGVADNVKSLVGGSTTINPANGTVTASNIGGTTANTIDGAIAAVKAIADAASGGVGNAKLSFVGDSGGTVDRNLNETLKLQGGKTTDLTDNNIGVVKTASDSLTVKLAKDINLGATGSVTTGATKVNNSGVTITTSDPTKPISLTANGLNNGGKTITNVGDAVNATDAVNKKQLDAVGNGVGTLSGATYNPATGTYTAPTGGFGGTGANNLNDAIAAVKNTANQPLSFTGNSGTKIDRTLGQTLKIEGGLVTTAAASNKNIRTETAGDTVKILLADAPIFTAVTATTATIGSGANTTTLTSTANGLDVGGDKITNVGDAVNASDAVNKKQLDAATKASTDGLTALKAQTFKLQANNDTASAVKSDDTVKFIDGKNVAISRSGNNITVATKDEVSFNKTTVGSVVTNGTTNKISGLAAGSVTSGSTEAVNGGQLFGVADSLKTLIGAPATLNSDGTVTTTNIGGTGSNTIHGAITEIKNIADSATKTLNSGNLQFSGDSGTKVTRNLGTELKIQGGKTTGLTDNNIGVVSDSTTNTLHVKLAKDINLGTTGSVKTGATTVNNSGVTIAHPSDPSKNVTLTGSGLNNGGNVISGVGKATAGDHAVNKDLLDSTVKAVTDSSNKALDGLKAQTFKLQVNSDTASAVKASDTVKFTDGKNVTITRSGNNITIATKDDVSFSKTTVGSVVTDSATNKISGLSGGTVASGSTEAITGGQLFAQSEGIKNLIGGNTTYNPTTGAFTNNNIGGTGKSTLNDAIMHINSTASAGWNLSAQGANQTKVAPNATVDLNNSDGNIVIAKTTASNDVTFNLAKDLSVDSVKANTFTAGNTTINNGGLTIANTDPTKAVSLTSGGLNNGGNKITNISAGTSATDAATIGQLSGITSALGGGASVDPNNGSIIAPSYQITQSDGSIKTVNSVGDAISSLNGMSSSPLTFAADVGTNVERRLGSTVSVNGDSKNITTSTTANGVKVALNNTINVSGVIADGVSIKGNGPTLTKNGMNMAGQAITNMANGLPTKIDANGNVVPMTTVDIKQAIIDGTLDASVLNNAVNVGDLVEQGNNVLNVSKNIYGKDKDENPYVRPDGTMSSAGRAALRTYNVDDNGTLEHNGIFDAIKNMNEQGIKFFHTNDGVVNSPSDGYSEEDSNANAAYSTAIGYKALVSKNAVAGLAVGPASLADGAYSVALGAESVARDAHVAAGTTDSAYTYGGLNDNNVAAKATKATRVASIGAEGKERQLQHVAAGVISPTSTDAVNGSQLYYTNKAVENNTRAINQLRGDVHKMDRQLRAGIAGATALSFLQRPNQPGKSVVSLGVGGYRGESAVAIGYSRNSDNNKISIKVGAGVNTRSDINYGASIGYQW